MCILIKPAHPFLDDLSRCIRRTIRDCRGYRSSHAVCRFDSSGSSGFVSGFRLLHWYSCVPVPKVRSCRDRRRYRYICRPVGFPVRGDWPFQTNPVPSSRSSEKQKSSTALRQDSRFHAGYGLLFIIYFQVF